LFFGAMLVDAGEADGMVAGATCPTKNTIRAAVQCIGTAPGSTIISSFFLMILPEKKFGRDGVVFYADCGVNPNPDASQLAEIAMATDLSFRSLVGGNPPKTALLSFSTKGSAVDPSVDKVTNALKIIRERRPEMLVDGELQFDAALIPAIGVSKAPGSPVAGKAEIFVFPDLNSGNIGYKITERLGKAVALGPILQGIRKPVNDLSRGCSVDDIVDIAAITCLQSDL
jgi:phosphate acetyltransferase